MALLGIALVSGRADGQQDAHYTNFMFNKLMYNPAYAGSREAASLMVLYRKQWLTFPGSPNDQMLTFHTPLFNRRMGVGLSFERDEIGFGENYRGSLAYNYRIPVRGGKGTFSIGIHGTVWGNTINWDEARASDVGEFEIPVGRANQVLGNFGAGVYYQSDRFYAGLSVPHLLNNSFDYVSHNGDLTTSRLRNHYYFMGGLDIPMGSKVRFTPNLLLKYVLNAPFDFDANISFMFFDRLTLGATYRHGDSVDALVHWYVTKQLRVGMGYDITTSGLASYQQGSFEILLGYDFMNIERSKLQNPRFF